MLQDLEESGTDSVIIQIYCMFLRMILLPARLISRSGTRKIWHAVAASLVRSGIISCCDTITSISRTSLGLVISFDTGEMIVISQSAYFYTLSPSYANLTIRGEVLDRECM